MRWFWLTIWALEFSGALIAVPVGVVMLALGKSDGLFVLLVAAGLIIAWAVQYFVFGQDPAPIS